MKNLLLLFLSFLSFHGLIAQEEISDQTKFEYHVSLGTNYSNNYLNSSPIEYKNPFFGNFGIQFNVGISYLLHKRVKVKSQIGYQFTQGVYKENENVKSSNLVIPLLFEIRLIKKLSLDIGSSYRHVIYRQASDSELDYIVKSTDSKFNFIQPHFGLNYMFTDHIGVNFNTQFIILSMYKVPAFNTDLNRIDGLHDVAKTIHSLSIIYKF